MTTIRVSAPGKVVLSGEYAVLYGAHAVAAAVDRRAHVTLQPGDSPYVDILAPGYHSGLVRYRVRDDGGLQLLDSASPPGAFDLFERTWTACQPAAVRGHLLTLDTSEFVDSVNGRKLGLGSSAALCVALTAALAPDLDANGVAALAGRIHRDFQGGGSGVDIACSTYGGVVDYRRHAGAPPALCMPHGLHFVTLWSGQPVSTGERIQALSASLQGSDQHATLQHFIAAANALAKSWRSGTAAELLEQFALYIESLRAFDANHNLEIFGGGHAELAAAATAAGFVYKPCGAGGGDIGVCMGLDRQALANFAARAPDYGFEVLALAFAAAGLRRDG